MAPRFARFTVPGKPEPQRRARSGVRAGKAHTYDDPRNGVYADRIRWAWREAGAADFGQASLELQVIAVFARPKCHWRTNGELSAMGLANPYHRTSPDLSNIIKAVEDALNGLAYVDDRQICSYGMPSKIWTTSPDEAPRLEVAIASLTVAT